LIYVGKQAKSHVVSQQTIGELLVSHASAGKCVARLKGGDPFVFGRGGEELADLIEAGIDFQVVPGISAANGCAAYAGIPLTHRDHATGVSFWTGHMKDGQLLLPWAQMSVTAHTHVIFMGLKSLPLVAEQLCLHGMNPQTPAAMISAGTTPAQQTVVAPICELPARAADAALPSPALLIVGDVVGLHDKIGWYTGAQVALDEFPFPTHI
jgi:uroporphyrin-III C-methyltransferase/precorrin-2 dehydrogenase/sirohydrochlorin ferrochelatase